MPVIISKEMTETEAYSTSKPLISYTPHPLKENGGHLVADMKATPKKDTQLLEVIKHGSLYMYMLGSLRP